MGLRNERGGADLIPERQSVRHLFQAAHHALVPEVVRKRLRPLGEKLHDLRGDVTDSLLAWTKQEAILKTPLKCVMKLVLPP